VHSNSIQKLADIFSKFPTVGSRTAARFAFYLAKLNKKETKELLEAVIELKNKTATCSFCFNVFEKEKGNGTLCGICSNPARDRQTICIVEKEADLQSIEQTKKYKGLYFVLGGTLSPLRKESVKKIRIKDLVERIKNPKKHGLEGPVKEIIIATNFTSQGEVTALYLERTIKSFGIKTTRLARGLPTGSEIEYIDEETISSALEGRK